MERVDKESSSSQRRKVLEGEIADLRAELGVVVHEIERRARQAVNVKRQARLHPVLAFTAVFFLAGALAIAVAYPIQRRRKRARSSRIRNLRLALAHLAAHPEHVMRHKTSATRKKLVGAGTTVGTFGAKRILDNWIVSLGSTRDT